MNHVETRLGW